MCIAINKHQQNMAWQCSLCLSFLLVFYATLQCLSSLFIHPVSIPLWVIVFPVRVVRQRTLSDWRETTGQNTCSSWGCLKGRAYQIEKDTMPGTTPKKNQSVPHPKKGTILTLVLTSPNAVLQGRIRVVVPQKKSNQQAASSPYLFFPPTALYSFISFTIPLHSLSSFLAHLNCCLWWLEQSDKASLLIRGCSCKLISILEADPWLGYKFNRYRGGE